MQASLEVKSQNYLKAMKLKLVFLAQSKPQGREREVNEDDGGYTELHSIVLSSCNN